MEYGDAEELTVVEEPKDNGFHVVLHEAELQALQDGRCVKFWINGGEYLIYVTAGDDHAN